MPLEYSTVAGMTSQAADRCCPNFRCSAGFQPALSRQDGGATFKLGQHPQTSKAEVCATPAFTVGIADNVNALIDTYEISLL
jgi:hypothetical protein